MVHTVSAQVPTGQFRPDGPETGQGAEANRALKRRLVEEGRREPHPTSSMISVVPIFLTPALSR